MRIADLRSQIADWIQILGTPRIDQADFRKMPSRNLKSENLQSMNTTSNPPIPAFLYGTAWKEADTERLTWLALRAGFSGIDTANQRKHYYEAGVGAAVAAAIAQGFVRRADLFLQ